MKREDFFLQQLWQVENTFLLVGDLSPEFVGSFVLILQIFIDFNEIF
jgi:hypothetical protein